VAVEHAVAVGLDAVGLAVLAVDVEAVAPVLDAVAEEGV
jgi:hypothetical protein